MTRSYAQNWEDVVLARCFPDAVGTWVDVGAAHPLEHSVTRLFHERGWRGVNVEASPVWRPLLEEHRPDDVNLFVAAGAEPGEATFNVVADHHTGGSTFDAALATEYASQGMRVDQVTVPVLTLAEIYAEHAKPLAERLGATATFLKVDVEGHELAVLQGADWDRDRPVVVVVEATEPNSPTPSHAAWEPLLLDAGYLFGMFDGLNRFYVRQEDEALLERLYPASWFDQPVRAADEDRVAELEGRVASLSAQLEEAQATQRTLSAHLDAIHPAGRFLGRRLRKIRG